MEKRELLHYWWECKLIQPLWKMMWRFLKKLGIKPSYDPATLLLGIYPEETKIEKDLHPLSFESFNPYRLEKEMVSHSSVLAWRIPGTEEPGGLPSVGSHRVSRSSSSNPYR